MDTRNVRMAPSPDSNSAVLTRGKTILELQCSTLTECTWQTVKSKNGQKGQNGKKGQNKDLELEISRNAHLHLPIPSTFVDLCMKP